MKLMLVFVAASLSCCINREVAWQPEKIVDSDMCRLACENIGPTGLGCEEGEPIEMVSGGCDAGIDNVRCVSCEKFCVDTQTTGVWLQPGCVASVKSCSEIEGCQQVSKR